MIQLAVAEQLARRNARAPCPPDGGRRQQDAVQPHKGLGGEEQADGEWLVDAGHLHGAPWFWEMMPLIRVAL